MLSSKYFSSSDTESKLYSSKYSILPSNLCSSFISFLVSSSSVFSYSCCQNISLNKISPNFSTNASYLTLMCGLLLFNFSHSTHTHSTSLLNSSFDFLILINSFLHSLTSSSFFIKIIPF